MFSWLPSPTCLLPPVLPLLSSFLHIPQVSFLLHILTRCLVFLLLVPASCPTSAVILATHSYPLFSWLSTCLLSPVLTLLSSLLDIPTQCLVDCLPSYLSLVLPLLSSLQHMYSINNQFYKSLRVSFKDYKKTKTTSPKLFEYIFFFPSSEVKDMLCYVV